MVWRMIVSCFGKIINDEEFADLGDLFGGGDEGEDAGDEAVDAPTVEHVEEEIPEPPAQVDDSGLQDTTTDGLGDTGGIMNE